MLALARHPFAAPALDGLYCKLGGSARSALLSEFYGAQFARARAGGRARDGATAGGGVRLADVLAGAPASTRTAVLGRISAVLVPILEKGLVSFAYVHRVLSEYLAVAGPGGAADAAASVAGPALLRMIHTPDGARAAAALLGAASARARKAALKALKGRVPDVARDAHGHVALLAALDCVDDTALLSKCLLAELLPDLPAHACHVTARRLLLHLLAPRAPRYLPPDVLAALPVQAAAAAPAPAAGGAAAPAADAEGAEGAEASDDDDSDSEGVGEGAPGVVAVSKKPPAVRRAQLLAALAPKLVAACTAAAPALLRHPLGCDVLFEAARGGEGGAAAKAAGPDAMAKLHAAIAAAAAADAPPTAAAADEDEEGEEEAPAAAEAARDNFFATRTLRRLVLAEGAEGAPSFASVLWRGALAGRAGAWAAGHGAKVLAACVVCGDAAVAAAAAKEARPLVGAETPAAWAARHVGAAAEAADADAPAAAAPAKPKPAAAKPTAAAAKPAAAAKSAAAAKPAAAAAAKPGRAARK